MIEEAFHLSGSPFRLSPDPTFFFASRSHKKALAYLRYGVQQAEGFIVITGEIGAGKSMLIAQLLNELDESRIAAAHLVTSSIEAHDIVRFILAGFKIKTASESRAAQIEAFEEFLIAQHRARRRVLLVVDEAQNLPRQTIEELRMLSNINYDGEPLFQIFLVGQPEFRDTLGDPALEQLRQRIIASYHLSALDAEETREYILHRMRCVGWNGDPSFTDEAFKRIHEHSGGTPRLVNNLCNRILLSCAIDGGHVVDSAAVAEVVRDIGTEEVVDSTASARVRETRSEEHPATRFRDLEPDGRGAESGVERAVAGTADYARLEERARTLEDRARRIEEADQALRETIVQRLRRMEEALAAAGGRSAAE